MTSCPPYLTLPYPRLTYPCRAAGAVFIDNIIASARDELAAECDYRQEALQQATYAQQLAHDSDFIVPRVHEALSSKHVLVTDFIGA